MSIKTVFMGTSEFAVPALLSLHNSGYAVVAVVTQPDRPQGRGKKLGYSPVKESALQLGIPVMQPVKLRAPESVQQLQDFGPDLIVVASYGQLIPPVILDMPRYGCINVHASLLPAYRGAAPIRRSIMNGDHQTGITVMLMDETLDTGDILAKSSLEIGQAEDHGQLEARLAEEGGRLLIDTLDKWIGGEIRPLHQDGSLATYAAMIHPGEEKIDWNLPAAEIVNKIRAFSPQPGAYTWLDGKRLKLFAPELVPGIEGEAQTVPGQIVSILPDNFVVQAAPCCVAIYEAQREGKKRMPSGELARGSGLKAGIILGV